jgi:predicted DCC family thiol-disulfide oxidoreductase YuxK
MNKEQQTSTMATMFYDGACPLCQREVAHYQKLDQQNNINWVDISTSTDLLKKHGIEYSDAMSRLHALDSQGNKRSGVDAFVVIWSALPYYRWLATIVKKLHITPLLEMAYQRFAKWRLARQISCDCEPKTSSSSVGSPPSCKNNEHA